MTYTLCMETDFEPEFSNDCELIATVIAFIRDNAVWEPTLDEVAARVDLSPGELQRKFTAWVGVGPERFLELLTVQHNKALLDQAADASESAPDLGQAGSGRRHDRFVTMQAVTPDQYRGLGSGLRIDYGFHSSPFGPMLLALTDNGICELAFGDYMLEAEVEDMDRRWPGAQIFEEPERTEPIADRLFHPDRHAQDNDETGYRLFVKGTDFQLNIWRALLRISAGSLISYKQLAHLTGNPEAVRATASAVGANPVSYLIPCHRVLRASGELGGYHWGVERKQAMIAWDSARVETRV
ncbi:MAG: methylated-DNA--[protein]-cysteine S-methyltransferase [Gammaproteobacteria bacterium]|nr:methylated-DNA--[protein]-cysteine S-methyltransferase [Gammaproteobacteria bacterium]